MEIASRQEAEKVFLHLAQLAKADSRRKGLEVLTLGLTHHPKSESLHLTLGLEYTDLALETDGATDLAIRAFEELQSVALSRAPRHLRARAERGIGRLRSQSKDYSGAVDSFRRALKLDNSEKAVILTELGYALSYIGGSRCLSEALGCLKKALKLNPNDATAWRIKARVLRELEKFDDSIDAYGRVLLIEPNNVLALCGRGESYRRSGNLQKGLEDLSKALALKREYSLALARRASVLADLDRPKDALKDFNRAIELDEKCGGNRKQVLPDKCC